MWRTAASSEQKKAILDRLIPLTKDDYVDAVIAFSEDADSAIREAAFAELRKVSPADLMRRIGASALAPTIRAAMRYCVVDPHPGVVARLIASRHVTWPLVTELWMRPQEELWRTLVATKSFVVLSHPFREETARFLDSFSRALAAEYREQIGWVTEKDLAAAGKPTPAAEPAPATPPPPSPSAAPDTPGRVIIAGVDTLLDEGGAEGIALENEKIVEEGQQIDVAGALFDTGKGIVTEEDEVVDLDAVELDVPDFMLSDTVFEGLSREEAAQMRTKISEIIGKLAMPQLVKLATVGNMEVRRILIKDPRRLVAMAVLSNGGITATEIAALAGNPMTSQDVVEHIANNRVLAKHYMVKFSLAMNPKTPVKLAMRYVEVLRRADLKKVADNKNVSPLIRNMAKKRMI